MSEKLRPSIARQTVRNSCFNIAPVKPGTYFRGALRDSFGIAVVLCDHLHEQEEEAWPCAAELHKREYGESRS